MNGMDGFQQQAVNVLLGKAKEAFDLAREDDKTKERYGPGLARPILFAQKTRTRSHRWQVRAY